MIGAQPGRRYARDLGVDGLLVEREAEIGALSDSLAAAREGSGRLVVIEGPAGCGMSRLLIAAADAARQAHMQILGAGARELERDFPFGVAIELFETRWAAAGMSERTELLSGPAELARGLLEPGYPSELYSPGSVEYALVRGLFWLTHNIVSPHLHDSGGGPLAIFVDDVQWADRSSLRFLNYLAERISVLPITLVITHRRGDVTTDEAAATRLCNLRDAVRLRPGPLSDGGVASLVRARYPQASKQFVTACAQLTRGCPFLLVELLSHVDTSALPPNLSTAQRLDQLAPEAILNSVVARLGVLSDNVQSLARAAAVLGDGASFRHAARLAGLDLRDAAAAADTLAAMHLLQTGEPLSFRHPLIRAAVSGSIPPLSLGHAHREAASILDEEQAPSETVAAHLLAAPADADPRAVEVLRDAARTALERGAADSAARFLERALEERTSTDTRAETLAELAEAASRAGMPSAVDRLAEAIAATQDPDQRARLELSRARDLYTLDRHQEALDVIDAAMAELGNQEQPIVREFESVRLCSSSLLPDPRGMHAARRRRFLQNLGEELAASQRLALAHVAAREAVDGATRHDVRHLVDRAWDNRRLLETQTVDRRGWQFVVVALAITDDLERAVEICGEALETAHDRGSPLLAASARHARAWVLYDQARIVEAARDARAALEVGPDGWSCDFRDPIGAIACFHLTQGSLHEAEQALAVIENGEPPRGRHPLLLDIRARLRLLQHRPEEALVDALRSGEHLEFLFPSASPGAVPWRSTAALAHLALGDSDRASELASHELEAAQALGVTRVVIRDLRVLGLASGGAEGIQLLREAVEVGASHASRLEYLEALIDLGAALRRDNQRTAARVPLREALKLSHLARARSLVERATAELEATGARVRSVSRAGVGSLTPSERRVAELATKGLTTRQMAESLFVTPKTVEFHLRHIYQKLDVNTRAQLPGLVAPESSSD